MIALETFTTPDPNDLEDVNETNYCLIETGPEH